jgi:tryptophan synthase
MGTTGSSVDSSINASLTSIIARVREHATVPLAVGFGVATRAHYDYVADAGADGVVIGSRLVSIINEAPQGEVSQRVEKYCQSISMKGEPVAERPRPSHQLSSNGLGLPAKNPMAPSANAMHMRFGQFGGQYVPEALFDCLAELDEAHKAAVADPEFWKEFEGYFGYMNRPSNLYYAANLTKDAGGASIWLKREDL